MTKVFFFFFFSFYCLHDALNNKRTGLESRILFYGTLDVNQNKVKNEEKFPAQEYNDSVVPTVVYGLPLA